MIAMALSVSTSRTVTLGSPVTGVASNKSGRDTTGWGTAVVAAIELIRKWRLVMLNSDAGSQAGIDM
jgi:hypothetical protein